MDLNAPLCHQLQEIEAQRPLTVNYICENIFENRDPIGATASIPNDRRLLIVERRRDPAGPHYVWWPEIKLFDPLLNEHRKFDWIGVERCVAYAQVAIGLCHTDYIVVAFRTPKNRIRFVRREAKARFQHESTFFVLRVDWKTFKLTNFAKFRHSMGSGAVGFCPQKLHSGFPLHILWSDTSQSITIWFRRLIQKDGSVHQLPQRLGNTDQWDKRLAMEYHSREDLYSWQTAGEHPFALIHRVEEPRRRILVEKPPVRFAIANAGRLLRMPQWATVAAKKNQYTLFFHWAPPNAFVLFREGSKLVFAMIDWKTKVVVYHRLPEWANSMMNCRHFAVRHILADRALIVDGFNIDKQKVQRHFSLVFEFGMQRHPLPLGFLAAVGVGERPNWSLLDEEERRKLGIPLVTDYEKSKGIRS